MKTSKWSSEKVSIYIYNVVLKAVLVQQEEILSPRRNSSGPRRSPRDTMVSPRRSPRKHIPPNYYSDSSERLLPSSRSTASQKKHLNHETSADEYSTGSETSAKDTVDGIEVELQSNLPASQSHGVACEVSSDLNETSPECPSSSETEQSKRRKSSVLSSPTRKQQLLRTQIKDSKTTVTPSRTGMPSTRSMSCLPRVERTINRKRPRAEDRTETDVP